MASIPEAALSWSYLRAGGPGGQHQNTSETAVQLRYSIGAGDLSPDVRRRLRILAGGRLNSRDEIVIDSREHRSRRMNMNAALARLRSLIEEASRPPLVRRPTSPTRASRERRMERKRQLSEKKAARRKPDA
jgi:ribosome-associated protein